MRVLQAFYGIYLGLLFMAGVVGVMPFYVVASFLSDRPRLALMFGANRVAMRLWSLLTGVRIRVEGQAVWQPAHVLVGNHCNLLDMPVCAVACARPVKVLAKQEFARMPLLGFLFRSFAVLVARDSADSRRAGAQALARALAEGWPVLLFPEGTRNRTAAPLQPFRDGAFRAAIAAQVPIQPFVQLRMRSVQQLNTLWFRPGRLIFRWLPPVPTAGLGEDDVAALRDRVYALIEAELKRDDPAFRD
ncbi:lysophospholipid acyltransferase family protein [Chitinimonas koreensis]|uniref:lysophospholipid acyltransferase family protein n=1 Tax=Chitinimonas koreensis TaxID=356302 RepID=UPI000401C176|nr:lysophospholipid acyltransferase family protein [Chitinimonas koreensis]QNM96873.1 1-acyl-sn-glycerol-3-phosphate acyltransferase [Chitinimonas koreensis]